jgi:polyisoprenoid-binding protein YceI
MSFKSTKIEHVGGDRYKVIGDLTIKGTTRPVTLELVRYGEFNDPMMGHRIGYAAQTKINRKEFGMNFDAVLDGRFVVSNEIQINIEGEIVEAADEPQTASTGQGAARKS